MKIQGDGTQVPAEKVQLRPDEIVEVDDSDV
jgi:hypothetical protein